MIDLSAQYPLIERMRSEEEVFWINERLDNKLSQDVSNDDIKDASDRLERFASYIKKVYTETEETGGIIESPLVELNKMKEALCKERGVRLNGRLLLKCDNLLPISGSIKARGGIYEVLAFAEKVAMENNMLKESDDYAILDEPRFRELFSKYSIAVGSTGNLGLSIGIMSAQLGFTVAVHMSADAKQWKKDLLREKGAVVVEYAGDYQKAVAEGRKQAQGNPLCHFVDDENSKTLFLGYTVAAQRTKKQIDGLNIQVDENHPLFVYLPCGVGGGPGGVAYGLKQIYGENVRCFFAEPVQAPCMLLGVMTGLHDGICVQDIGLSGKTSADGLAVGRPSKLVGRIVGNLLDGLYTATDDRMEQYVVTLFGEENIFVEPSAAAGISGYYLTQQTADYLQRIGEDKMANSTHIVWATGGSMVPDDVRGEYLSKK